MDWPKLFPFPGVADRRFEGALGDADHLRPMPIRPSLRVSIDTLYPLPTSPIPDREHETIFQYELACGARADPQLVLLFADGEARGLAFHQECGDAPVNRAADSHWRR